jgi:hypothetical protein
MTRRQAVQVGAVVWAAIGAGVALGSLGSVNSDARVIVGIGSLLGPLSALLAAAALARHHDRTGGVLLVLSAATPTYFAWILNVPALLVGLGLLIAPSVIDRVPTASSP